MAGGPERAELATLLLDMMSPTELDLWLRAQPGGTEVARHVSGGLADEYARAGTWLEELRLALGLEAERICLVPGNHDVDRTGVDLGAQDRILGDPQPQRALGDALDDATQRAVLTARFEAFVAFVRRRGYTGLGPKREPWWMSRLTIRGLQEHLAGFCSPLLSCSDRDRGRLALSRYQEAAVLKGTELPPARGGPHLALALAHHPPDYLAEWDAVTWAAIQKRCGVFLRGHLHRSEAAQHRTVDLEQLGLAAGTAYSGSEHPNGWQFLLLDREGGTATVHFRRWDGHDWKPDRNRYDNAPDGTATLPLRRSVATPT